MRERLFRDWVPTWLGNTLLIGLLLPVTTLGGLYAPVADAMTRSLGTSGAYFTLAGVFSSNPILYCCVSLLGAG